MIFEDFGRTEKKLLLLVLLLLFCFWLFAGSATASASGTPEPEEKARISDAQERAEYVKGTADEGRRIIAECQSILREVRSRGETNPIKN